MSYTEIYIFGEDGAASFYWEVDNAFRGAMAVWMQIEKKYLPSLPVPDWEFNPTPGKYYSRFAVASFTDEGRKLLKEVWDLRFKESPLSKNERIVFLSTMDEAIIKRENLPELIKAYREYEGETSLPEQADILEKIYNEEPGVIAVGFNQTSVCADPWVSEEQDEDGEWLPYNILEGKEHFDVFDCDN